MKVPGRKARTLLITQHYRPEPNFISADVGEMLATRSEVVVITAHPNYPHGRFYPGTRWWWPQRSAENGVVVWRLPMIPDHSSSILRRLVSYLSFLLLASVFAPFVGGRPSVVWVYQTPFTMAIAAIWFKLVHGARLVYTCADLWPESFIAAGVARPGLLIRLLLAYRRWSNRWADAIICSTRGTMRRFEAEGFQAERLHFIPVWVEGVDGQAPAARERGCTLVYAGNLGPAQQLETLVRAAAVLQNEGTDVTLEIYGTGSAELMLREVADQLKVHNVVFRGRVAPGDAFRASSRALGQIVSLRSSPMFRMTIPSKLFFCFAAASPILYALEGEAADLAKQSGGGIAFEAGNHASLAQAVRRLIAIGPQERARMRNAVRQFYERNFSRDTLLERYRAVLELGR